MKITILPSFWIVAGLFGYFTTQSVSGVLFWVPVILVSVLVHEWGHASIAMFWKQRVRIELGAFGGATIREGQEELPPLKEFLIVMMGPLFGFLLATVTGIGAQYLPGLP